MAGDFFHGQEAEQSIRAIGDRCGPASRRQHTRLRLERGISQEDLAAKIGTSFQQLQKYETGKNRITVGRLVKICEALEVSLDEIIDSSLKDRLKRETNGT